MKTCCTLIFLALLISQGYSQQLTGSLSISGNNVSLYISSSGGEIAISPLEEALSLTPGISSAAKPYGCSGTPAAAQGNPQGVSSIPESIYQQTPYTAP